MPEAWVVVDAWGQFSIPHDFGLNGPFCQPSRRHPQGARNLGKLKKQRKGTRNEWLSALSFKSESTDGTTRADEPLQSGPSSQHDP